MTFWIYAPNGGQIKYATSNSSNFAGNKSTGTAQTKPIDTLTWPEGNYRVEFAQFEDIAGNGADTRYGQALGQGVKLSTLNFTVTGTAADTVDPVLTSVSMKSAKTLRPGQTPTFEWVATDTSQVRNMTFWIYAPNGGQIKYATSNSSNFAGNKSTGTAQTKPIDTLTWPEGNYRVEFAQFEDIAGNGADTRYGQALGQGVKLSTLNFTVSHAPQFVVPKDVTFLDRPGSAEDSYVIPFTEGVDYFVGEFIPEGTYKGEGSVSIRAEAQPGYELANGARSLWEHTFDSSLIFSKPTITGIPTVGNILTAAPGVWGPSGVKLTYQWAANGTKLTGATKSTLPLTADLAGKTITVNVTGTLAGYTSTSKASTPTPKVARGSLTVSSPEITGIPTVGNILTAAPGVWGPSGVKLTYQWAANGTKLTGATKSTLPLTADLAGKTITVNVTGTLAGYTSTSKASTPTPKVARGSLTVSSPEITGIPTVGNILTAAPGVWGPSGVKLTYQWAANGTKLTGATKSTLPLTADLAGKTITVNVTGTLAGYTSTSKASAPTAKIDSGIILAVPKAPTIDRVTGSYTIPSVIGIDYVVNGATKSSGTYSSGYSKVSIIAEPQTGYSLSGTVSWSFDLRKKIAIATEPKVNYSTRVLTIPSVTGVSYYVDGVSKKTGSHKFSKQISVSAKASAANYQVAKKSWKYDLRVIVTASKPVFDAKKNTVKIPAKTGVTYYVNGTKKKAGTHKYTGTGTVTAKASSNGYKLKGTTSWKFDNRNSVTASKPVFDAKKNTVKIPAKTGVTYYVNGTKKKAGTHKYTGTGTVTAKASSNGYKLKGTTSWKFDNRNSVTASKPVFDAKKNTVKIPAKTGVTYYVNGTKKKAGTHKYTGTGTVTAKASSNGYKLKGTTSWKFENRNSVTASKPVFDAKKNTVKIPAKTGVTYYVNGTKKKAGTHKYTGTGKVTVAAKPSSGGYKLKGTKSWSANL
ncbi:hypothetical protein ACX5K5_15220 [Glutamicibacter bergerei]